MYPDGLWALILQVISSWQVIAVTVALVFFLRIVFYTARAYRPRRTRKKISFKFKRKPKPEAVVESQTEDDFLPRRGRNINDELGLEEE
ncbi:MAG: hypothetical protein LBU66_06150 [Treponema sp.]|jgi:hypothetical protein|nr:hypothetical protein [Treponema sp.]